jgi:hypothetical protein
MKKLMFSILFASALQVQAQTWVQIDSVAVSPGILAGEYFSVCFDNMTESLRIREADYSLTALAKQALARAPDWVRVALLKRFIGLTASNQNTQANRILNAIEPYVDEVSFMVAHNSSGEPELVYEIAESLDYVDIADHGTPGTNSNYYSTCRYRIKKDGVESYIELPRDKYYFYVLPPLGDRRTYFFHYNIANRPSNPAIKDKVRGQRYFMIMTGDRVDSGAVRMVHPCCVGYPDPVLGDCYGGSRAAPKSLRAALAAGITVENFPGGLAHGWSEFHDGGRWRSYEPFGGACDTKYWGQFMMIAPTGWREDGYTFTHVEIYRPVHTFSGTIRDASGNPLDGAKAYLSWKSTFTDHVHTYTSKSGRYEIKIAEEASHGSHHIEISKGYSGSIPQLQVLDAQYPANPLNMYKVEYDIDVTQELVHRGAMLSYYPGAADFFICDNASLVPFIAGSSFDAFQIGKATSSAESTFVIPTSDLWYLTVSNKAATRTGVGVDAKVRLYKKVISQPFVGYLTYWVDDAGGNSNGYIDPGETVNLYLKVKNYGNQGAVSVSGKLRSSDFKVEILDSTATYGDIAPSGIKQASYQITADSGCGFGQTLSFDLLCEGSPGSWCASLEVKVFGPSFWDNVENGVGEWAHGGNEDQWHISTTKSYSPTHSWHSGYKKYMDSWLISRHIILQPASKLTFWHTYGVGKYDSAWVQLKVGDGAWQRLNKFTGSGGWSKREYDLSSHPMWTQVQVRFRIKNNSQYYLSSGWYVDDISVAGTIAVEEDQTTKESRVTQFSVSPNPFSENTVLQFRVHGSQPKADEPLAQEFVDKENAVLQIYDLSV